MIGDAAILGDAADEVLDEAPAGTQGHHVLHARGGSPEYLRQQIDDFKSGARRVAWQGPNAPSDSMIQDASPVSAGNAKAAMDYFSGLKLKQRSRLIEAATIPRIKVTGWTYGPAPGTHTEALGERLLEVAPDATRDARRDDQMQYNACVPPGVSRAARRSRPARYPGTRPA